jgi:DNA replication protein DnaC
MNTKETLQTLNMRWMAENHTRILEQGAAERWSAEKILELLCEGELEHKRQSKVARLLSQSCIDRSKTLDRIDWSPFSPKLRRQIETLAAGKFVDDATNVLAFGLPGRGKTHLVSAIGLELVKQGFRVLFRSTRQLVEELLAAKAALRLQGELKKLDNYDVVICDDIGYVQQTREEMEVFFAFLAQRYERRSIMITSNLVFSEWEKIFKDPMTTAAAIDRVIHHSVILEVVASDSWRASLAEKRAQEESFTEANNFSQPRNSEDTASIGTLANVKKRVGKASKKEVPQ